MGLVAMFSLLQGTNPLGLFKDTLAGELDTVAAIVKCLDVVLVSVVQTDVTSVVVVYEAANGVPESQQ
jgi:hypothetical protein